MVKAKTMYGDVRGQVSHASLNCFQSRQSED